MPKKSREGQQTAQAPNDDAEVEPGSPRSRAKAAAVYRTRQKSKGGISSCRVLLFGLFVVLLYVLFIICMTTKPGSTAWDQRSIVKKLPNGGVAMNLKPGGPSWLQVMLQELSIEQVVTMYEKTVGWKQEELMKALPKEQQVEFKRAILLAKGPIVGTERGGFGGGGMVGADPSSLTGAGQGEGPHMEKRKPDPRSLRDPRLGEF